MSQTENNNVTTHTPTEQQMVTHLGLMLEAVLMSETPMQENSIDFLRPAINGKASRIPEVLKTLHAATDNSSPRIRVQHQVMIGALARLEPAAITVDPNVEHSLVAACAHGLADTNGNVRKEAIYTAGILASLSDEIVPELGRKISTMAQKDRSVGVRAQAALFAAGDYSKRAETPSSSGDKGPASTPKAAPAPV